MTPSCYILQSYLELTCPTIDIKYITTGSWGQAIIPLKNVTCIIALTVASNKIIRIVSEPNRTNKYY
jgi:hypothetical protein